MDLRIETSSDLALALCASGPSKCLRNACGWGGGFDWSEEPTLDLGVEYSFHFRPRSWLQLLQLQQPKGRSIERTGRRFLCLNPKP